jgi:hypothetical protein
MATTTTTTTTVTLLPGAAAAAAAAAPRITCYPESGVPNSYVCYQAPPLPCAASSRAQPSPQLQLQPQGCPAAAASVGTKAGPAAPPAGAQDAAWSLPPKVQLGASNQLGNLPPGSYTLWGGEDPAAPTSVLTVVV